MLKNYFKVAIRNLWKNKGYSAINIIGLSSGLAVCLLIVLYVINELGYDQFNKNADRIYRLDADLFFNNTAFRAANTPEPMGPTMVREYPKLEQMVRISNQGGISIKKGDQTLMDQNAMFADSTFFKVFSVEMIEGDPNTALSDPSSIVISESAAKRYFNSAAVLGKSLYTDNQKERKITGVYKDFPRQSHFHFDFIKPFAERWDKNPDGWLSNNHNTYILVKPGTTQAELQSMLNATTKKYVGQQLQQYFNSSIQDLEGKGNRFNYQVMPLRDIHLKSNKSGEIEVNGDVAYVYIFSVIAAFILLIACVNFMNLSTARSANRAKEVGIRKVVGSLRSQLIFQFLTESVLLSLFSLVIAILIALLLLPFFNSLAGQTIPYKAMFSSWMLPVSLVLVLIVGCIAGSYPAFYLSAFQPIEVLKGKLAKGFKSSWLRSSLVVFQYSISIVLIIGTIVIYNQLEYIRNRNIGYNRNQVMVLHNTWPLAKNAKSFKEEVRKLSGVENVTVTQHLPTTSDRSENGWFPDATMTVDKAVILANIWVDEDYIPTLGMQMAAGRNFSRDFPSDSLAVVLNEAAVKTLGFKEPLRATLYRPSDEGNKSIPYRIVGVVKDYNFSTMHEKIKPLVMQLGTNNGGVAIRINSKDIRTVVEGVRNKWNGAAPGQQFNYSFMDEDFNKLYKADDQTGRLFMAFALFAIFIACLGLFGLVTYAAEQRTKEIGIRKVLGANIPTIVTMLSRDFVKLVFIAALVAFPIAWWTMNKWLQEFAFRISIGWWVFVIAGALALLIAILTTSFQAIRAALANPVKSLRSE